MVICHRNSPRMKHRQSSAPTVARASLRHAATEMARQLERFFDHKQRIMGRALIDWPTVIIAILGDCSSSKAGRGSPAYIVACFCLCCHSHITLELGGSTVQHLRSTGVAKSEGTSIHRAYTWHISMDKSKCLQVIALCLLCIRFTKELTTWT